MTPSRSSKLGDLLAQGRLRDMDDGGRAGEAAGVDNFHKISELAELHMTCVELRLDIIHRSAFFASSRAGFFLFGSRPASGPIGDDRSSRQSKPTCQAGHGSVRRFRSSGSFAQRSVSAGD